MYHVNGTQIMENFLAEVVINRALRANNIDRAVQPDANL